MDEIINNLSLSEQIRLYLKLQNKFNKEPEYTIKNTNDGRYCTDSKYKFLDSCAFEKPEYAKLAYYIAKNTEGQFLVSNIRYVFRVLNIDSEWRK